MLKMIINSQRERDSKRLIKIRKGGTQELNIKVDHWDDDWKETKPHF